MFYIIPTLFAYFFACHPYILATLCRALFCETMALFSLICNCLLPFVTIMLQYLKPFNHHRLFTESLYY